MFPGIGRRTTTVGPIGIELALEKIHFVQLQVTGGQVRLKEQASLPLGGPLEQILDGRVCIKPQIRQLMKSKGFKGHRAVTAMPSALTRVISVNYQADNTQGDDVAIAKLLRERIGDEVNDFVVDFMPINTHATGADRSALIAMCNKEKAIAYLETIRSWGLEPTAMEIGPVAIKRLVNVLQSAAHRPGESALIVNCGRDQTYLTLVTHSNLLSDDEIPFGESRLVDKVVETLELDAEVALSLLRQTEWSGDRLNDDAATLLEVIRPLLNELIQEIQRGLVYAATENRGLDDTSIYLVGSIARWNGAGTLLSDLLNRKVTTIPDPLQPFLLPEQDDSTDAGRPELAVAAGLALREFAHG